MLSALKQIPLAPVNIVPAVKLFLQHTFNNFWSVFSFAALFVGVIAFAKPDWRKPSIVRTALKWLVGFIHGAAHINIIALVLWCTVHWSAISLPLALPDWNSVARFDVSVFILGGLLGSFIFGIYLILSNLVAGFHRTEAFSALENKNHKSFLRMEINKKELVIHAIGLEKTAHHWQWEENETEYQSWLMPASEPLKPKIIGKPIRIKNK